MSALTVKSLCKAFGGLRVTTNVDLNVEPGERRLIIGPNGAGKTTLFNLITGELTPDSGSIVSVTGLIGGTGLGSDVSLFGAGSADRFAGSSQSRITLSCPPERA